MPNEREERDHIPHHILNSIKVDGNTGNMMLMVADMLKKGGVPGIKIVRLDQKSTPDSKRSAYLLTIFDSPEAQTAYSTALNLANEKLKKLVERDAVIGSRDDFVFTTADDKEIPPFKVFGALTKLRELTLKTYLANEVAPELRRQMENDNSDQ